MSSILTDTKKVCGITEDYTVFDADFILYINSVFGTLNQLGLGPTEGFEIEDKEAEWADFQLDDTRLNPVRTYVYLRVRLLFDPPQTGYLVEALTAQVKEHEWRLNEYREETEWTPPE